MARARVERVSYAFKFGTAGIRARLGPAQDELNLDSVRVIAHAIVSELATLEDALERELVVAYDGRRESRAFAEEVCAVALAAGFGVALFEPETPTPLLAFAARGQGKIAGVMITASHNPPDDNGIKLYLAGGRQVGQPHDRRIEARIAAAPPPERIARRPVQVAQRDGQLRILGELEQRAYLAAISALLPASGDLAPITIAYSALHGVGAAITRRLLAALGGITLREVAAQAEPRADFGGLKSPNPEHAAALAELQALAQGERLELAFAHDPDADRLAVLARLPGEGLRALSGDEVGALIGDFLLRGHPAPATTLLASTLVSGGLLERIALAHGAHFVRAATGFKWIAALGRESAARTGRELLFGYEEALGYAFFAMADDKDGIAALAVMCRLAQRLLAEGKSLAGRLAELWLAHGVFSARQLTVDLHGDHGADRLAQCLETLRALSAEQLLGAGARVIDYEREPLGIPLLVFDAAGARVCVRPSGTEPKLKLYLHARELVQGAADLAAARARAEARLDQLEEALRPRLAP